MSKKYLLSLLIVATMLLISVAPGLAQSDHEPVTIVFGGWIGAEEASQPILEAMIEGFQAEYPWITVETVDYPWSEQQTQLILAIAGGNPPDVAQLDINFPALLEMGVLEPLESYFDQALIDDLIPAAAEAGTYNDQLLMWPWRVGTIQLVYNPTLLEAAGLPNRAPETLDELRDWAIAINDLGDDIYGLGMTVNRSPWTAYFFLPLLWSFGGDFFDENGHIIVNNEAGVASLEYFANLVEQGAIPVGSDVFDFRALYAQSRLGFYLDAPLRGTLRQMSGQGTDFDNQIATTPMPVGPSGVPGSSVWGHWLGILRASQHKEEAALFIQYLTTNQDIVRMYGEEGAIPALNSLLSDPMFQDPYIQAYLDGLETARSIPGSLRNAGNFLQALDALSIAMSDVVLNGADPQEALDQVALTLTILFPGATIAE